MINGVLGIEAACGSLEHAYDMHDSEFDLHNLVPNAYSDR